MMRQVSFVALLAVAVAVSGCGTLKKFTKKSDNTVLPGDREEILSPDQYKVEDATVAGGGSGGATGDAAAKPCNPDVDPDCSAAIDQEAAGSEG